MTIQTSLYIKKNTHNYTHKKKKEGTFLEDWGSLGLTAGGTVEEVAE